MIKPPYVWPIPGFEPPMEIDLTDFAESESEDDQTREYVRQPQPRAVLIPPAPPFPLVVRRRPGISFRVEIRDLLVAAPWMFSIGLLCGALHLAVGLAAVAGGVAGVGFDRWVRRWI